MQDSLATWLPLLAPALPVIFVILLGIRMWRASSALKAAGLPMRPAIPRDALFVEKNTSGRLGEGFRSLFRGVNNALLVWVTRTDLATDCVFPVNLFAHGSGFDFHQRIPLKSLTSVSREGPRIVIVGFHDRDQKPQIMRLHLRTADQFVSTLRTQGVRVS